MSAQALHESLQQSFNVLRKKSNLLPSFNTQDCSCLGPCLLLRLRFLCSVITLKALPTRSHMPSLGICHGLWPLSMRTSVSLQWNLILLRGLGWILPQACWPFLVWERCSPWVLKHLILYSISHNEVACFLLYIPNLYLLYIPNDCNREQRLYNAHHGISGPDTEPGTLWANTDSMNELQDYSLQSIPIILSPLLIVTASFLLHPHYALLFFPAEIFQLQNSQHPIN